MSVTATVPDQREHGDTSQRTYRRADELSGEWVFYLEDGVEHVGEVQSVHVYRDTDDDGEVHHYALTVLRGVDGVVLSIPTFAKHEYKVATDAEVAQAKVDARAGALVVSLQEFVGLFAKSEAPGPSRFLTATLRIPVAAAADVAAAAAGLGAEQVSTRVGVEAWWPKRPVWDFGGPLAVVFEWLAPVDPDADDPQGLGFSREPDPEPEPARRSRVPSWLGGGAVGHPPGRRWPRQEGL